MKPVDLIKSLSIDKNSPVPIYSQIESILRKLIQKGKIKEGEKIPTEKELCTQFNVSRVTARQAISGMVNSGILLKMKAKGTFVKSSNFFFEISSLKSFSEDMKNRGFKVSNKLVYQKLIQADTKMASNLQINANDKVWTFKRLRYVNDEAQAIEISRIPLIRCPDIIQENLEKESLFNILENKYHFAISYSEQSLKPTIASQEQSKLMHIETGAPLLEMTGTTFLTNNLPIEYATGFYRGDRYRFHLTLRRD